MPNHHESGNTTGISTPLARLASFFDQLGRYEAATTIAGFAFKPVTKASFPELGTTIGHLRVVLGSAEYESLALGRRRHDDRRYGDLRIPPN